MQRAEHAEDTAPAENTAAARQDAPDGSAEDGGEPESTPSTAGPAESTSHTATAEADDSAAPPSDDSAHAVQARPSEDGTDSTASGSEGPDAIPADEQAVSSAAPAQAPGPPATADTAARTGAATIPAEAATVPTDTEPAAPPAEDTILDDTGNTENTVVDDYTPPPVADHERIVPLPHPEAERPVSGRTRWGRRVLVTVVTLVLMGLIPAFLARLYAIPSGSMETTLHGCPGCDNDRVLVDRLVYRFSEPRPGEIVVFNAGPDVWKNSEIQDVGESNPIVAAFQSLGSHLGISPPTGTDFIKRVIAVGGQTVSCCDRRNRITVDGAPVDEPYLYFAPEAGSAQQKPFPRVRVPEGQIFVMGDNRNGSVDSRAPGNGPVPVSLLAGKARFIVLPFDRFGALDQANPQQSPTR